MSRVELNCVPYNVCVCALECVSMHLAVAAAVYSAIRFRIFFYLYFWALILFSGLFGANGEVLSNFGSPGWNADFFNPSFTFF